MRLVLLRAALYDKFVFCPKQFEGLLMQAMLTIAVKAARAAGTVINRAAADMDKVRVSRKQLNDYVTETDEASEKAIIDTLLYAYPDHAIWAEESGRIHGNQNSEFVWIIDPLDGTTNFVHGLPIYCVSIAVAHRGVVQHAVVFDPNRNDLFTASKGSGAFLNNRRIRVSKRLRLADSLIGTGFAFRPGDNFPRYLKMFEQISTAAGSLRRPGAAALDLAYVAAGYYDGFFESGLHPWDVAAGSLLVTEAGGLVGNYRGEADYLERREIVAGSPKVYGELIKLLGPFSEVPAAETTVRKTVKPTVRPTDAVYVAQPTQGARPEPRTDQAAKQRAVVRRVKKAVGDAPV
jgi:myo-inositol-1(or 4)-monophosphatase